MKTTRVLAVAALTLTGITVAQATEVIPAWRADGFVMEEVVVTAEAPASYYMEEIVVTAQAPEHLYMEEVVVTATVPRSDVTVAALETSDGETYPAPVMEEIVVTGHREELSVRFATRLQNRRNARHF